MRVGAGGGGVGGAAVPGATWAPLLGGGAGPGLSRWPPAALAEAPAPGGIVVSIASPEETYLAAEAEKQGLRAGFTIVEPDNGSLKETATLVGAGKLRVGIDTVLPLKEAAKAHELRERGRTRGRIVLSVASPTTRSPDPAPFQDKGVRGPPPGSTPRARPPPTAPRPAPPGPPSPPPR
ncbi:zinc-binding dehydrogenase [Streptomyces sp. CA-135486]|uniref:zinc-binding dehydrogenase n=1 Tax=Streptomyces sp. CA-135486 TaxID=3240049 RepID=UPI003D8FB0CA